MKVRAEKGLANDLDTSVWRLGKNDRLRVGGDRFTCRKHLFSLLICCSACSSAGQLIFNLTQHESSPPTAPQSPYGASALSHSPSSEDEMRSAEPAPQCPQSGLPICL